MNPQHFGSDPTDIGIRIRVNSEIRIQVDSNPGSLLVEVRRLGGGWRSLSTV